MMKTEDRIYIPPPKVPRYRWPEGAEPVSDWKTFAVIAVFVIAFMGLLMWKH